MFDDAVQLRSGNPLLSKPGRSTAAIERQPERVGMLPTDQPAATTQFEPLDAGVVNEAIPALEKKGAAVRYVTQFCEYALARKQADASERIKLLVTCDLMRHLPAEQIEQILPLFMAAG
jgi:hypothetical protein